jgi:hypothetical protein
MQGSFVVITSEQLDTQDVDTAAENLVYTISNVVNGQVEVVGKTGRQSTFTQAEINAGAVQFVHDGSETLSAQFAFNVSDGNTTLAVQQPFPITVNPLDDAPVVVVNTGATVAEVMPGRASAVKCGRVGKP